MRPTGETWKSGAVLYLWIEIENSKNPKNSCSLKRDHKCNYAIIKLFLLKLRIKPGKNDKNGPF